MIFHNVILHNDPRGRWHKHGGNGHVRTHRHFTVIVLTGGIHDDKDGSEPHEHAQYGDGPPLKTTSGPVIWVQAI